MGFPEGSNIKAPEGCENLLGAFLASAQKFTEGKEMNSLSPLGEGF